MTPRPSRTDVLTAFRRAALLDAARAVFGQCGYERATMERIAREAGVAKGTIYLYYRSKHSIYWAALSAGIQEMDELTRARLGDASDIRGAIEAFIATKVDYFDRRRDFFRIYVSELGSQLTARPLYSHPELKPLYTRQVRILQGLIAAAVGRGEIRQVAAGQTAAAIVDLTRGLVMRRLVAGRRTAVAHDVAATVDLIWRGLAAKGTAKR